MTPEPLEEIVRNIDARLTHVEQILPTLATKAELHEAIAPLATKSELRDAKSELREAIAEAVAPLATKVEMREAITEEGERTRRHFDVVAEGLRGDIRLVAEGQDLHRESDDRRFAQMERQIVQHDRRLMRLEAMRAKPNR